MAKKLYEEADVQAVAAAIRLRNGSSTTYKLSQMASAIESMKTGDKYVQTDVPEYVRTEALAVAKKVSAVQTTDSITYIAASDAHHHSDDEYIADGNLHAGMAMKALSYIMPGIDFCCFLGDYSIGSETTTLAQGRQHFAEINAILKEGFGGIPGFALPATATDCAARWRQTTTHGSSPRRYTPMSAAITRARPTAAPPRATAIATSTRKSCAFSA